MTSYSSLPVFRLMSDCGAGPFAQGCSQSLPIFCFLISVDFPNIGVLGRCDIFYIQKSLFKVNHVSHFVDQGLDPARVNVPVIGGHAGKTIIPLISQVCL